MKKLLLSFLLLFSLILFTAAHADTLKLQDPEAFSYSKVRLLYKYDKDSHLQTHYTVEKEDMLPFIDAYLQMLDGENSLLYLGVTQNGKHIYHCYGPAQGYDYDTFSVKSYGQKITPTCCLAVQYEENDTKAYLRYSKDFLIEDLGLRIDMAVFPTSVPTPAPTPTPTPRPTRVPTATPVPTQVPTWRPAYTYPPTQVPTRIPTQAPTQPPQQSGYGYVTANSVNLRKGPGTNYGRVRFLNRYAFAQVVGSQYVGNTLWYHIVYAGYEGYIMGDFFKTLSITELQLFLASEEYLLGIKNNTSTTVPTTTPTPYRPPVYVPTRTPYIYPTYAPVTQRPATQRPATGALNIQDPGAYSNSTLSYEYSFTGINYKQHCYRMQYGNCASLVESYVNMLRSYEPTLNYGGVYKSADSKWTYHYFTSYYGYSTFSVYYDSKPVTPASCLVIGYSSDRVYLYYSPSFTVLDEGIRK